MDNPLGPVVSSWRPRDHRGGAFIRRVRWTPGRQVVDPPTWHPYRLYILSASEHILTRMPEIAAEVGLGWVVYCWVGGSYDLLGVRIR